VSFFTLTFADNLNFNHEIQTHFLDYVMANNKNYQTVEEFTTRLSNFINSHDTIETLNMNPSDTAKYGLNELSDLSQAEFN